MKKWKLTTKRGFALFIALLMCMGAMQLTAFAAEEDGLPVPEVETVTNADEPETDPVVLPEETQPVEGADETQEPADAAEPVETEQPEEPVDAVEPADPVEVEEPSDAEPAEEEVAVPEEPEAAEEEKSTAEEESPAAETAAEGAPYFTFFRVGSYTASMFGDKAYLLCLPNNFSLLNASIELSTDQTVSFVKYPEATPPSGSLYISNVSAGSATISVAITTSGVSLDRNLVTLSSNNGQTWQGDCTTDLNVGALADTLASYRIVFPEGSMISSSNVGNAEQTLFFEQDNTNTYVVAYADASALRTVTYSYGSLTETWNLPLGATIPRPDFTMQTGTEFNYWYIMKDGVKHALTDGDVVEGDITVIADTTSIGDTSNLAEQMGTAENMATTARTDFTIGSKADWMTFVNRSNEFRADQTVTLTDDIIFGNDDVNAFVSISFAGNFNGGNHKIANATFSASGGNSGVFAKVNAGRKVANLKLDNIVVESATYAGVLAGYVEGSALVQNIQVTNSTVNGRTAGGVVGFLFTGTVKYCSSSGNMTISGIANSGGIVGISYGTVSDCYSTYTGSGTFFKKAGIVSSNLECGVIEHCWTCSSRLYAAQTAPETYIKESITGVTNSAPASRVFRNNHFNTAVWQIGTGTSTVFKPNAIILSETEFA